MAALWIVYTAVHGPTSFDQTRVVWARLTLFWGSLLSIPPSLFVALGLILQYPRLVTDVAPMARIGYALTMLGLLVPAGLDLFVWGGLGPPFFVPVVGTGLILLALGRWPSERQPRSSLAPLIVIGIFQFLAFALALIPNEASDQVGGYRLYGLVAHVLTGLGWVAFGASLWRSQSRRDQAGVAARAK